MTSLKPSSPFSNLAVKETATLTWTIDRFEHVDEDSSPFFNSPNSGHQFNLELNTKFNAFDLNRVLFELSYTIVYKHQKEVPLRYRISILDANGAKHYAKEYFWNYKKSKHDLLGEYNVTSYISRVKCEELLVNGSLTIYWEVDILAEKADQLSTVQTKSFGKLSENYETLLKSGKLSDFIVQIGHTKFRVHKAILAAQSAVFAAMFEHSETQEMKEGRVVIVDVAADVFELVIQYIYTGKVETLGEQAEKLLVAADKYQLDHLKSICEQSLISTIATESVSNVLLLSDMHNVKQLKSKCIEYIVDNWKEVKETKCWVEEIKGKRADLIEEILDFRY